MAVWYGRKTHRSKHREEDGDASKVWEDLSEIG
jgi:hypothetical protein